MPAIKTVDLTKKYKDLKQKVVKEVAINSTKFI